MRGERVDRAAATGGFGAGTGIPCLRVDRGERGKRLDPSAAESITECEGLLGELLHALKRHERSSDGGTQEIDSLVKRINQLHEQIDSVLDGESESGSRNPE